MLKTILKSEKALYSKPLFETRKKDKRAMGQLSVTFVASLLIFLTYYLVVFSVVVHASPLSSVGSPEQASVDDNGIGSGQQPQSETVRNVGRMFKPFPFAYSFNRNIRTPFSNSISSRLVPAQRPKMQPLELDLVVDDDDFLDKSKRYDDYGHMRFGKRGDDQFDDYGHMRFGKRHD